MELCSPHPKQRPNHGGGARLQLVKKQVIQKKIFYPIDRGGIGGHECIKISRGADEINN